jgi:hypothetical protein
MCLQGRVIIGDFNGFFNVEFESWVQCSQGDILLTEKLLFLCILELQNIYIVLYIRTNYMLNISVLVDLSSFDYVQIISMMLWNDAWMKGVELI